MPNPNEPALTPADLLDLLEKVLRKKTRAPLAATIDGKRIDDVLPIMAGTTVVGLEIFTRHGESIRITRPIRVDETEIEVSDSFGGNFNLAFQPAACDLAIRDVLEAAAPPPTPDEIRAGLEKAKALIEGAYKAGVRAHIHGAELHPPMSFSAVTGPTGVMGLVTSQGWKGIASVDGEDHFTLQITESNGTKSEIDFTRDGKTISLADVIDAAA